MSAYQEAMKQLDEMGYRGSVPNHEITFWDLKMTQRERAAILKSIGIEAVYSYGAMTGTAMDTTPWAQLPLAIREKVKEKMRATIRRYKDFVGA